MAAAQKRNGQTRPLPGGIAIGTATAAILCLVLSGIIALLIHNDQVKENTIPVAAIGILFLSSCFGGMLAGKWVKKQLVVVCGLTGAVLTVILLGITIFAFDATFTNVFASLTAVVLGSVVASMLCAGKGRSKKRRSRQVVQISQPGKLNLPGFR